MNFIKKVPLSLSALMLGTAALGNLVQSNGETYRIVSGVLAAFLLVLLVLKLVMYPKMIVEDLKSPIMAGVSGTFPMSLMILSTYLKPVSAVFAFGAWAFAIILHIALIVFFTMCFVVRGFELKNVFTVWYIVYVGIAAAGVAAPAFDRTDIGAATFWFGIACTVALLVLVTVRYVRLPVPEPAKPLIMIYAAPISLCVAAYVQSVTPKSLPFLMTMSAASNIVYIIAIVLSVRYLAKQFYLSWGAYTFPFVITAIATKQTMACAVKLESPMAFLGPLVIVETVLAVVFIAYIYVRFMMVVFGWTKERG